MKIKDLFGLDERQDVERVEMSQSEQSPDFLYLLRCDDILADGKIAINEQHGMVGIYENTLAHKIEMNSLEIATLTLLVLSRPLSVQQSTLQCLYTLYMMRENEQVPDSKSFENALQAFMITCNAKLCSLGIMIETTNVAYHITAISKACKL